MRDDVGCGVETVVNFVVASRTLRGFDILPTYARTRGGKVFHTHTCEHTAVYNFIE